MKAALERASESVAEAAGIVSSARLALAGEAMAMPDGPESGKILRLCDAMWASEQSLEGLLPWLSRMIGEAAE